MSLFDLSHKIALVTGGNRGIGKAISFSLAKAGADIIIVQRSDLESEVVGDIKNLGRRCETIKFDLSHSNQVHRIINQVVDSYGRLDILVNNAGVQRRAPAVDFPEEYWNEVMNVNATSVFFLSQAAGKVMLKQGSGKIINLASLLTFQGGFTVPAYAASKGAVGQFTKSLANEWASQGVNVNAIAPGYMLTEMNTALMNDEVRSRQILERIPAGRWGTPEDIAGVAVFLASDAANYIHGETITVDGGWMGR